MKTLKLVTLLFLSSIIISCSSTSEAGKNLSIQYKGERAMNDKVTQYNYSYWVEDGEPQDISVYVSREGTVHTIVVGSVSPNMNNEFTYNTATVSPVNFVNEFLNLEDTANSLREATDKAVTYFLQYTVK